MTMKTAACAMAVALLAGTASFAVPAAAQYAPMSQRHAKIAPSSFPEAVAERRRRIRGGNSARRRELVAQRLSPRFQGRHDHRGLHPSCIVVNSAPAEPILSSAGYSTYDRNAAYYPRNNGYSSYDGRSYDGRPAAYDNGALYDRYDAGNAPRGLMDVVVAPAATAPAMEARAAMMSYCIARYQSYDPASGTYLADDGNRYFCR